MMRILLVVAMSLALAACGSVPESPVKDQETTLSTKQLCCEDLQAISYDALTLKSPKKVVLDADTQAKQFPQGRSYFKAFSLPQGESQGIWIKSYFNGLLIKQFLQPLVLFLDSDHKPIGVAVPRTQFRDGNMFGDRNARMEGGVRVPNNARYLLVYTTRFSDAPESARIAPSTGAFLVGNTPVVTANPGRTIDLERAMTGELSLELEDLTMRP